VRTLGVVGDTEHVEVVEAALDDPDVSVRMAAERAMTRLVERLDLTT
jgi:HEAT repeat protein